MAEKRPGLLKRIFSFGFGSRKTEAESQHEAEPLESAPPPETETATPAIAGEPAPATAATTKSTTAESQQPAKGTSKVEKAESSAERPTGPEAEPVATASPSQKIVSPPARPVAKKAEKSARRKISPDKPKPAEDPAPKPDAKASAGSVAAKGREKGDDAADAMRDGLPSSPPEPGREGWFKRLRKGLARSSDMLVGNVSIFTKRRLDEATLQELEDVLIQADLGVETAISITDALAAKRLGREVTEREIRRVMADEIEKVLAPVAMPLELDLTTKPHVILVVGVNGSGKTTTIGKLAAKLRDGGYSTVLVAGDTFRAAAIEQLTVWGERTGSPVVARQLGADAAGLAYDAYHQAVEQGHDVMIMDTAGRLQNKKELMAELEKIVRVLKKQDAEAPHTVLLTLDATTGQNALSQVEIFKEVAGVNGLVMTKLDGTARGGILVAIAAKFALPVFFVGVGEQVEDLEPFEAREFANSIADLESETEVVEAG